LRPGSTIARADTRIPLPNTDLMVNLDRLVNSVNRQDLEITIDELGAAFNGTGPDLQRLIDSGNSLIETADQNLPQTTALIDQSGKVLKTQVDEGSAILGFSRDLAALTPARRPPASCRTCCRPRSRPSACCSATWSPSARSCRRGCPASSRSS
jgi:phospholipid/cholesterol/gamma-HCH transport system substrate-binding protein